MEKGSTEMLKILFKIPQASTNDAKARKEKLAEFYTSERVKVKPYLLNKVEPGERYYGRGRHYKR